MQHLSIPQIDKEVSWLRINWKDLLGYTSASANYVTRDDIDRFIDWRIKEVAKIFSVDAKKLKKLVVIKNEEFYEELEKFYSTISGRALYNSKFQEILSLFKLPDTRPYTSKTYKIMKSITKKMYLEWKKFKEEVLLKENY